MSRVTAILGIIFTLVAVSLPYALGYLVADGIRRIAHAIFENPAIALLVAILIGLVWLYISLILTMRAAIASCSPQSRALNPNWIWLMFSPISQIAGLVFVPLIASSITNEFRLLASDTAPRRGTWLGITAFVFGTADIFIFRGEGPISIGASAACFVFAVLYWRALRRCVTFIRAARTPQLSAR